MKRLKTQVGYTLIELVLAMAIFSFILLIVLSGFLNIVHLYQNGLVSRDTQDSGRSGIEEMVRHIRMSTDAVGTVSAGDFDDVCLVEPSGNAVKFMAYSPSGNQRALYVLTAPGGIGRCAAPFDPSVAGVNAQQLTSDSVEVVQFKPAVIAAPTPQGHKSVSLVLKLAPSTATVADITTGDTKQCNPTGGPQFCAVTIYQSSASLRGNITP